MNTKAHKILYIAIPITIIAIIAIVVAGIYFSKKSDSSACSIDGEAVTEDELQMYMNFCKSQVAADLSSIYSISLNEGNYDTVIDDDETGTTTVYDYWKHRALTEIATYHAVVTFAYESGAISSEDYSYEKFIGDMEAENTSRNDKLNKGEIVYGAKQFSAQSYYSYITSNMKIQTLKCLQENNSDWTPTTQQLKDYYNENKALYKAVDSYEFDEYIFASDLDTDTVNQLVRQLVNGKNVDGTVENTVDGTVDSIVDSIVENTVDSTVDGTVDSTVTDEAVENSQFSVTHIQLNEDNYRQLSRASYLIYQEAVTLNKGQASNLINNNGVNVLLICTDRHDGGYRDFDEYKDELLQEWLSTKYDEYIKARVSECTISLS